MAFSTNQQQIPNPAPPFPSAGDHEMRDYHAPQTAPRPPPQDPAAPPPTPPGGPLAAAAPVTEPESYLTPYLGLRARLSQTWINRWTILLLLVLIRTLLALASLDDNLGSARREALSACRGAEKVASAMASMPHYMAGGVNELTAAGVEKAVEGLMRMLMMSVTAVEEMVLFVINLLTSTYVCLITLAVGGSLHAAVEVAEKLGDALNSTLKEVGDDLGAATADFDRGMDKFLSGLTDFASFVSGKNLDPPTIDLTDEIDRLAHLQLPTDYDTDLRQLNASIPTFDQVHNFTNAAIRFPFEEVKTLLNASLPRYTLNRSRFPVPPKERLSFCTVDNDSGIAAFFDHLLALSRRAKKLLLVSLLLAALLVMIPMAYRELHRYRLTHQHARLLHTTPAVDPLDTIYLASRPHTGTLGLKVASFFPSSSRSRILTRWAVAYATTPPALFVLSLGLAGLAGCLCQAILLKQLARETPHLTTHVADFTTRVLAHLDTASAQWATGTNALIADLNDDLNHDLLGWVHTSTSAVNDTLTVFVDGMVAALNTTFGGTVLHDPIRDVLDCLILLKIQGIQHALTWVHTHARVDLPRLANDTFALGAVDRITGSLAGGIPAKAEAEGGALGDEVGDEVAAVLFRVLERFEAGVRQETWISAGVVLVWVLVAVIGGGTAGWRALRGVDGPSGFFSRRSRRTTTTTTTTSDAGAGDGGVVHCGGDDDKPALIGGGKEPSALHRWRLETWGPPTPPSDHHHHDHFIGADNAANKYRGQPYTLTPTPLPPFAPAAAPAPSP